MEQQHAALHKEEQIPAHTNPSQGAHPSERTWIIPSHDTQPVTGRDANVQPLPLCTEGGFFPSDSVEQGTRIQDNSVFAVGVGKSSATEGQSVKTKTHKHHFWLLFVYFLSMYLPIITTNRAINQYYSFFNSFSVMLKLGSSKAKLYTHYILWQFHFGIDHNSSQFRQGNY